MRYRVLFKAGRYWPQYKSWWLWHCYTVVDVYNDTREIRFFTLQEAHDYLVLVEQIDAYEIGWPAND